MLYTSVTLDLASAEIVRRRGLVDWIAGLLGRDVELGTGEELTTVDGLTTFKRISDALAEVGVDDVLSVVVDGRAVFVDLEEASGDLETAVREAGSRRRVKRGFEVMNMVLSWRGPQTGLHVLVEVELRRRVALGKPELVLHLAGRGPQLAVRAGESARDYVERLRVVARDGAAFEASLAQLDTLADEIGAALARHLPEPKISRAPTRARLIRPGLRQLSRLRALTWGSAIRQPQYRPVPVMNRRGAYDEPFYHHYFDPYFDLVAWVLIDERIAGRGWGGDSLEVVDAEGAALFKGGGVANWRAVGDDVPEVGEGEQLLWFGVAGDLRIHALVPDSDVSDPEQIADARDVVGYGGDGRADEGAVGADWSGESGCGASCGGCGSVGG